VSEEVNRNCLHISFNPYIDPECNNTLHRQTDDSIVTRADRSSMIG